MSSLIHQNLSSKLCSLKEYSENLDDDEKKVLNENIEDINEQIKVIQIIRSSSIMMHILNAAILNSGIVKQGRYIPTLTLVQTPIQTIQKLLTIFEYDIEAM